MTEQNKECLNNNIGGAEHLVLSSAGVYFLTMYGAVQQSILAGDLNPRRLKSICGTSAGFVVGILIAITHLPNKTIDWEWIDEYIYTRDVSQACQVNWSAGGFMDIYLCCGVYSEQILLQFFGPIFFHHGIRLETITLAGFHEMLGGQFDLIGMATRYDTMQSVELTAVTHPNMTLLQAVHATCCIPFVFRPCIWVPEVDSSPIYYLDGGMSQAYPLEYRQSILGDLGDSSIFGVCVQHINPTTSKNTHNLVSFAAQLINVLLFHKQPIAQESSHNTFYIPVDSSISELDTLRSFAVRRQMVETGRKKWMEYIAHRRIQVLGVLANSE